MPDLALKAFFDCPKPISELPISQETITRILSMPVDDTPIIHKTIEIPRAEYQALAGILSIRKAKRGICKDQRGHPRDGGRVIEGSQAHRILQYLSTIDGDTVARIAHQAGGSANNIDTVCKRLEKFGLLICTRDEVRRFFITRSGKKALTGVRSPLTKLQWRHNGPAHLALLALHQHRQLTPPQARVVLNEEARTVNSSMRSLIRHRFATRSGPEWTITAAGSAMADEIIRHYGEQAE